MILPWDYVSAVAKRGGMVSFVILGVMLIVLIPDAISIPGIVAKDVTIQINTLVFFATRLVPNFVAIQNVIVIHLPV